MSDSNEEKEVASNVCAVLKGLFDEELPGDKSLDQEVVAVVRKHLYCHDIHSRAGHLVAAELIALAETRAQQEDVACGK